MKVILIAAVSLDGAIGNDNDMLWHLSEDLKMYKEKTIKNDKKYRKNKIRI